MISAEHLKNSKEKFAILILAHTDPVQLKRLVCALDYPLFDIFIHFDKAKDIGDFNFNEYNLKHSELTIIPDRIRVNWGDISIVKATLNMYQTAFNKNKYSRYITLSGLDYPILSNDEIYQQLSNPNIEFIMGSPLEPSKLHKVECFYYFHHKFIGKIINLITTTLYRKLKICFGKSYIKTSKGEKWEFYFSPQWHALSGAFVEYMLEFLAENPYYYKHFRFTYAPDELLIPTLLFNSPFKNNALISNFPEGTHYNLNTSIHYLNYDYKVKVFDENDYETLIGSGKCFARKLSSNKSEKLIEMLNQKRNKN